MIRGGVTGGGRRSARSAVVVIVVHAAAVAIDAIAIPPTAATATASLPNPRGSPDQNQHGGDQHSKTQSRQEALV